MTPPPCLPDQCSWRMAGFTHHPNRKGGGIANVVRRVCERCGGECAQIEVSWPDGHLTVEAL